MTGGTALEMTNVSLSIDGAPILRDASLTVEYGRLLALVGPNGAGKSSMLSVLSGDRRPTQGEVSLEGRPIGDYSAKELARHRAVLLQSNEVTFGFTVAEVVEMGRSPWSGGGDDESVIAESIVRADVGHLVERRFSSLSGGEKARTSLARVLAQDARIVLLDEPTAALDLRHQEEVLSLARELAAGGRAVVVVLHDLSLAGAYADDVCIVADGTVCATGAPGDVLTAQRIGHVYGIAVRVTSDPDTGRPVVTPRRRL